MKLSCMCTFKYSLKYINECVHRQLDDVPVVSPKGSKLTERFVKLYRKICGQVGVPLAPYCEKREKAFGPGTFGTVLGINFDSESMSWSLGAEKEAGIQTEINNFLAKKNLHAFRSPETSWQTVRFCLDMWVHVGFSVPPGRIIREIWGGAKTWRKKIDSANPKRWPLGLEKSCGSR